MNPYEPVASVDSTIETSRTSSGVLEWEGHRFSITAEQIPMSLWLVGCINVQVDDADPMRFIKWRWNKQATWTIDHHTKQLTARLYCSGANQIHCRLLIEDIQAGESIVSAKSFGLGLLTVAVITGAMTTVLVSTFIA